MALQLLVGQEQELSAPCSELTGPPAPSPSMAGVGALRAFTVQAPPREPLRQVLTATQPACTLFYSSET